MNKQSPQLTRTLERPWFIAWAALFVLLALAWHGQGHALTANETYTIVLSKVNSDGSTTDVSSTTATADTNGKITFTLSSVPTTSEANFIVLTVKDSGGATVRKSLAPTPASGSTNNVGVNGLTNAQADAMLAGMANAGTDDPIYAAFGFVIVRSPDLSSSDINNLALGSKEAILGTGGFVDFLQNSAGITSTQLDTMRSKLVYNSTANTKDLSDYVANFKNAVDNPTDATDEMAKAGGFLADIFVDAGNAAGIDPMLILAAHSAAGEVAGTDANLSAISDSVDNSINQAMSAFFTRVSAIKLKTEYTDALNALGASGTQVTRFTSAVATMVSAFETIDTTYGEYFEDPQGYLTDNPSQTEQQIQQAIDTAFESAFSDFMTNIASTNSELTDMRTAVIAGLDVSDPGHGMSVSSMASDGVGTEQDFEGNTVNWPIPQTVAVSWVGDLLAAGGNLTYTRDTLTVPSNMSWLNGDGSRTDFVNQGIPAPFAALMGIMEDVMIVEFSRYTIYDNNQQPSMAQEKQARLDFQSRLEALMDDIGGTTDGSTAISDTQKKALLKMMMQPSLD